ncbi:unnamed protein product, partial [Laminaria digitata]
KPGRAGRRGTVLEAFGRIEPALEVTEPSDSRGQVRVEKQELRRWLQEAGRPPESRARRKRL